MSKSSNDTIPLKFLSIINKIQNYNNMTFDYERNDDGTSTIKYNIVWDSKEEDKKPYQKYDEKEVIPQIISNNSSAYLLLLDNRIVKESEYYKEMEEEKKKKRIGRKE